MKNEIFESQEFGKFSYLKNQKLEHLRNDMDFSNSMNASKRSFKKA